MKRVLVFLYGVICYAITMATFAYMAGFLANFLVPTAIDAAPQVPLGQALLINVGLIALFGLQHSVMARPGFKRFLTRVIPQAAERSTYCLMSSLCLFLLFFQWQPMGGVIWSVQDAGLRTAIYSLYAFGWVLLVFVTFLINHFDLFGLRQVYMYLRGKEYTPLRFVTPMFYKYLRHPLYVGWFIIFWATPTMTVAHLVFALTATAYILTAIPFEERDLVRHHGSAYAEYRRRVPMFIPKLTSKRKLQEATS